MNHRVLLVNQDPGALEALQSVCQGAGLHILLARCPQQAWEILEKDSISTVLIDNLLCGIKGLDLCKKAREISPRTVRILLSEFADFPSSMQAINNGDIYRFVIKPWERSLLRKIVHEAIERFCLHQSLRIAGEADLLRLAEKIELKDPHTKGHCQRVAGNASLLAEALHLDEQTKHHLKLGAWLHDCGKIGVPETVLNHAGSLNAVEFDLIRKHPLWGGQIAEQAQCHPKVRNVILYHHERFDGQGYPEGLQGKDIPLEARLVAIADVFDALTHNRPFRKAFSHTKALSIIKAMRGNHLDPDLTDLFIKLRRN